MTKKLSVVSVRSNLAHYVTTQEKEDIISLLLADTRSPNTKRAYQKDLMNFFIEVAQAEPTPEIVAEFLTLPRATAVAIVTKYKAAMMERGLAEATVNRRLAAIKSLVRLAQKLDKCEWSLEIIKAEKIQKYRDTSGVSRDEFMKILSIPDINTLKGIRDYAILHLLWSNALRRSEVCQTDIKDFDASFKTLGILGKGKGSQKEFVKLGDTTVRALSSWLEARSDAGFGCNPSDPLFIAVASAFSTQGHRLMPNSIYEIVRDTSAKAGITKVMSPHRCRHSAITEALDRTGGDVRKVQKFSRHAKVETVLVYDDNRKNFQGEITDILSQI